MKRLDWFKIGILVFLFLILFLGAVKVFEFDNYWKLKKMTYDGYSLFVSRNYVEVYSNEKDHWVKIDFTSNSIRTNMKTTK